MEYPWYDVVAGSDIQQGDVLFDLEVPEVHKLDGGNIGEVQTFDVVVMTQSCDIPKETLDHLILCPVWQVRELPQFGTREGKENLRKGRFVAYHLLNKCDLRGLERDYMVVQFERVIERPKAVIRQFVAERGLRLRLLPPYREHLSQAFARFFMRVGLPVDIPEFTK